MEQANRDENHKRHTLYYMQYACAHIEYYTPSVKSLTLCKRQFNMCTGMGLGMTQQLHLEIWVQRLYPDVIWVLWQYSVGTVQRWFRGMGG